MPERREQMMLTHEKDSDNKSQNAQEMVERFLFQRYQKHVSAGLIKSITKETPFTTARDVFPHNGPVFWKEPERSQQVLKGYTSKGLGTSSSAIVVNAETGKAPFQARKSPSHRGGLRALAPFRRAETKLANIISINRGQQWIYGSSIPLSVFPAALESRLEDVDDELYSDLPPQWVRLKPLLIIGNNGTGTYFHYDQTENVVTCIEGCKHILLINRAHQSLLSPQKVEPDPHALENFARPDLLSTLLPELPVHGVQIAHIRLTEGHSAFLPSDHYHLVYNEGFSISLSLITTEMNFGQTIRPLIQNQWWVRSNGIHFFLVADWAEAMQAYPTRNGYHYVWLALGQVGELILEEATLAGLKSRMTPAVSESLANKNLGLNAKQDLVYYFRFGKGQ